LRGVDAAGSGYAERTIPLVADQLVNGTRFRALTIVDVYTREALAITVGQRLKAEDVAGVCNRLVAKRGSPVRIFVDNVLSTEASLFACNDPSCGDANMTSPSK
jgi:transposase InsO family protein